MYIVGNLFFLLLKTIHPYKIYNNQLLTMTIGDMKFTEKKNQKKVKKIL